MKILLNLGALLMVALVFAIVAMMILATWRTIKGGSPGHAPAPGAYSQRVYLANIAAGTHERGLTLQADAVITQRFLLAKYGSDGAHFDVAGATDQAIGVCSDEVAAIGDNTNIDLLGRGPTKKMVAGGVITPGARVYQGAGGKVFASGTRCVGQYNGTVNAALNDEIEVLDIAHIPSPAGYVQVAAGQRTWAGGVALTENFAVPGVLAGDLVLASWNVVAGTITALKIVPTTDTLTITTSANQANGDKYSWQVLRPA